MQHTKFNNLVHIDAYRLNSSRELQVLDWERTVSDPHNIIFIEWPEQVLDILPENHAKISFKFISEGEREIEF
jgi:tRNA A37 threonylcarbamoyladenosine biosynthesis protein TsaE